MTENLYTKIPTKELESGFEKKPDLPKYGFGVRHVQALIIFIVYSIGYIARSHLGVTIVAMTNDADDSAELIKLNITLDNINITELINSTTTHDVDGVANMTVSDDSIWNIYKTYHWSKPTQEMVLSSFFVGYSIMTFLSGPICQRWGGKIPLQIAMLVNGVVSILSPWLVAWGGWKALCFCRILQGLAQGGLLPSIHTLLANWVPLSERSSLSSYVYTGSGLGTVVGFQFSGVLATSSWGWPSPFWVMGVFCLFGYALVTIFGAATPNDHKKITEDEKNYIIGSSGEGTHTQPNVPWKAIMSSRHTWATFITHTSSATTYVFFFIQVPTYLYAILKVNIKNSGLFSSLPYIFAFFACIMFGFVSDVLINRKILSMRNTRRLANSIGSLVPAICLALVSYTSSVTVAVICFVTAVGTHGAVHSGWVVNYIDLSPNYSGVLMAIGNGLGNSCVLILSTFMSFIVRDVTDIVQWRTIMFSMAGFNIVGNTIFFIFSSADVQPWNEEQHKEPEDIKLQTKKEGLKN